MLEFVLTRKIIGPGYMKGELAIEGTTFRCLTLEAKDPRGHQQAANVALTYAIPAGKYPVIYRVYSYFPLTPYIMTPGTPTARDTSIPISSPSATR